MKRKRPWNLHGANRFACYRRTEISHDRALRPLNYNEGHTKLRPANATPPIFLLIFLLTGRPLNHCIVSLFSSFRPRSQRASRPRPPTFYRGKRKKRTRASPRSATRHDTTRHDTTRHDTTRRSLFKPATV